MACDIVRPRLVWTPLICFVGLVLVSCLSQPSGTDTEEVGAPSTNAAASPTVAAPSTGPGGSPGAEGSTSATSDVTTTMETMQAALQRFGQNPPTIHGVFETRAPGEGVVLRDEVWVAWPAFRVEQRSKGGSGALIVATNDGRRFGYRDPVSGEVGVSKGLGEGAFALVPMVQYLGQAPAVCATPDIHTTESMMNRTVIHIGCADSPAWDEWIDVRTGLLLRKVVRGGEPGQADWIGYVRIEFDPQFNEGLFDPHSV
jgi:hypothetical protein